MKPIQFYAFHKLQGDIQKLFIKGIGSGFQTIEQMSSSVGSMQTSTNANMGKLRKLGHSYKKKMTRNGLRNIFTFKLEVNNKVVDDYYKNHISKFTEISTKK